MRMAAPPTRRRGITQLVKTGVLSATPTLTRIIPGDYWDRLLSLAFTVNLSATAGLRSLAVNYTDGDGYIFNATPIGFDLGPSYTGSFYGDLSFTPTLPVGPTVQGEGTATTPAAGATIATTAAPIPGQYNVTVTFTMAGTPAQGTDNNNIQITSAGGSPATIVLDNGIGAAEQTFGPFAMYSNGSAFAVKSIALATTGAIYSAEIEAVPSGTQSGFTLPDLTMESGFTYQIAIGGNQAGDTITNAGFLLERYSSNFANGGMRDEEDRLLRLALAESFKSGEW